MTLRSVVLGVGAYLPQQIMTNQDFAAKGIDTSDEWIRQRTGIQQRHIAADGELTSDLAIKAAQEALKNASIDAGTIDLIILATTTPDHTFPATAVKVQAAIGANKAVAFDMQAVCSGFLFAFSTADQFLKTGQYRRALVIGAETLSRILDWTDRGTSILFGDGAGAIVLEAQNADQANGRGILSTHLRSDGTHHNELYTTGGVSQNQSAGFIVMNGKEVFKHAVTKLAEIADEALKANGMTGADLDWVVPHQANIRIIESVADKLKMPMEKIVTTVQNHGNTSAASVPLALYTAWQDGRIQPGQTILLEALGGGFTWGSAIVVW